MPTGKNSDDIRKDIEALLEHNGVVPTARIVEDVRRLVVKVAAEEKSRVTEKMITDHLIRLGLIK